MAEGTCFRYEVTACSGERLGLFKSIASACRVQERAPHGARQASLRKVPVCPEHPAVVLQDGVCATCDVQPQCAERCVDGCQGERECEAVCALYEDELAVGLARMSVLE